MGRWETRPRRRRAKRAVPFCDHFVCTTEFMQYSSLTTSLPRRYSLVKTSQRKRNRNLLLRSKQLSLEQSTTWEDKSIVHSKTTACRHHPRRNHFSTESKWADFESTLPLFSVVALLELVLDPRVVIVSVLLENRESWSGAGFLNARRGFVGASPRNPPPRSVPGSTILTTSTRAITTSSSTTDSSSSTSSNFVKNEGQRSLSCGEISEWIRGKDSD